MNLRQMEHLIALADTGSFSRAAASLHLTQSALSRSIQSLEEELGGALFDRIGKRNALTPLGQLAIDRARRISAEARELLRSAELLQAGELGQIRVGLGSGPGALLTRPLLSQVARLHPGVQVSVSRGSTELQLLQLRAGALDAMVIDVRRIEPAADLQVESLGELRAGFVCRTGHPLADGARVSFENLLRYPIGSTPLSAEVARRLVEQYGPQAEQARMVTLFCEDIDSLIDAVEETDALFLGIVAAARARIEAGRMVELPVEQPVSVGARFALVTMAGRTEAPVMRILRRLVAERLRD